MKEGVTQATNSRECHILQKLWESLGNAELSAWKCEACVDSDIPRGLSCQQVPLQL